MGKNLKKKVNDLKENYTRVRYPKGNEVIGIVDKRLGGSRMKVKLMDGREIMAIVPGRVKKYLWIREGDAALLKPWELDKKKMDLIYKFSSKEIKILKKKNLLEQNNDIEEF